MKVRAFWNDCGAGRPLEKAEEVDFFEASRIWTEEIRGIEGNYLGLIDENSMSILFYFRDNIPDHADNPNDLKIVFVSFPRAPGSATYGREVAIGEVHRMIETVFEHGADHRFFGPLIFKPW